MPSFLIAPFTTIDLAYKKTFEAYLENAVGSVVTILSGPFLACVTLWIIVQGILVMRGDIDARKGLTKLVSIALIVGLVTSSTLYHDYVEIVFKEVVPSFVQELGGNMGLPTNLIPVELDVVFRLGQAAFQNVAAEIPPMDELDALAFEGAQFFFYFSLWSIFGIYHTVEIMTSVLITIGPLFLIGFLFEATQGMTFRWIGQLITYAILLLLVSIVATVVVGVISLFMTATFVTAIVAGPTAGKIIGLYELDLFIMTGNALVVALPTIAASIAGGVGTQGSQLGQSIYRQFASRQVNQNTIRNMGMIQ